MEAQAHVKTGAYLTRVKVGNHEVVFDEPVEKGGNDKGAMATEMIAAALVACTATTLQMYAKLKEWPLESIDVKVTGEQEPGTGKLALRRSIVLSGPLDEGQRDRLLGIANRCPVHKILSQGNDIVTQLL